MISTTFTVMLFLFLAFATQLQFCWALFVLRQDPGLITRIGRGISSIKPHHYGAHHEYQHGVFHTSGYRSSHRVSALTALASPSVAELSTSIAHLQGQLSELAQILQNVVPQGNAGGDIKPLPVKQGSANGKPPSSAGVAAKGGSAKIAGTAQAAPPGVDLVPVHEAHARIDAFLRTKGNVSVSPVIPGSPAPEPTQQVQDVSPPSGGGDKNADGYAIKLHWNGQDYSFSCPEDKTILEVAMDNDLDLPHSCMSGSCLTCPGRIKSGTVDQSDGILEEDQLNEGYLLTCISYPKSNLEFEVLDENELL